MSAEFLASIAGILLSLAFSYIGGSESWYNALEATKKRLIMLGALLVVAGAVFGLSCAKLVDVGITCDQAGAMGLLSAFIAATIANQAAYALSPKAKEEEEFIFEPPSISMRAGLAVPGKKAATNIYSMVQSQAEIYVGMAHSANPKPTSDEKAALQADIQVKLEQFLWTYLHRRLNDADRYHIQNLIAQAWMKVYGSSTR
jgi:hypothetical protein